MRGAAEQALEFNPLSRLIIISNRVQPLGAGATANQGGLAVALLAALRANGGTWFGWSGETVPEFTGVIEERREGEATTATIDLEPQDVDEYYNGYANRTLWPLFHYRLDLAEFEKDFAGGYARVNQRFADTVAPRIEPDDLVWVHDYHLIPLGQELRARGCKNRIGFFLHIPWPPTPLMLSLPSHRTLVEAMLAYDVVGFQSVDWLKSFRAYLTEQLGAIEGPEGTFTVGDRTVTAIVAPIGISTADFERDATGPTAIETRDRLWMSATGRAIIVGVDRLDYSKGLEDRFAGYERFLANDADRRGLVTLLQIAPPSREQVDTYRTIRANLDALSGRINGEFADMDWVPIRYVNKGYPRDVLAGIYRAARIALVTPLRDGMNLVAKEYVAAQDPADPGVLILSEFAGAARQMPDALLVNPQSPDAIAEAITTALVMPREERINRWERLIEGVRREDIDWWCALFLEKLATA